MLRLLKWIFYIVVIFAVVFVAGAMLLPSTVLVSRSVDIAAPPEKVFAIVGDLKRFNEFSPWADIDPNTQYTFAGPEQGVGQTMSWASTNERAGSGSMTMTDYQSPTHVAYDLEFAGMGKSEASWDLEPTTAGTKATWWFSTRADGTMMRWLGLMFDRWIGADYEKGLTRLKAVAEKP
jgi:hypothetical protein